jgi:hypothetical protein
MYWEIKEAREELAKRQQDQRLVKQVNRYLGNNCPVPQGKYGFLVRHIATTRLEDIAFFQRCMDIGLKPVFLEYQEDVFCSNNPSKMRLIKFSVFRGYGRKGGACLKKVRLIKNTQRIEGIPLNQVNTDQGENLVVFHHCLFHTAFNSQCLLIDASNWLKSIGRSAAYYRYFFACMLTRGILFESFESPGFPDLENSKTKVVIPSFKRVEKMFKCSPLVVRHPDSCDIDEEQMLDYYPYKIVASSLI